MNSAKLAEFSAKKMVPATAKEYLRHIMEEEMPCGLKRYMELELFPQIQQKVKKGATIKTACQFLLKEGFCYVKHKKGLYYNGHEHSDVVEY